MSWRCRTASAGTGCSEAEAGPTAVIDLPNPALCTSDQAGAEEREDGVLMLLVYQVLDASAAPAPVLVTDMLENRRLNICCYISVAALY